jgi:hypothetical protein
MTAREHCPRCGLRNNSSEKGGTDYCLHCECGYIQCADDEPSIFDGLEDE